MHKNVLIIAALLALSACSSAPSKQAAAPAAAPSAEATKPALSDEAKAALAKAEADVKAAKKARAYWKTADDAVNSMKKAADAIDNASVIKHAKKVSDHVAMGIAQKGYPSTELP
jgi:uncharacterized protein YceK